jgi:chemotaxis protein histidine kinase CheA
MENESSLVVSRKLYIEKTPHRTACMTSSLLAIWFDNQGNTDRLLRQLRGQAEAGRRAGFESIVSLCQSMENCVLKIGDQIEKPQLETAISTLVEACRVIARHAEIITGMARPADTNLKRA